LLVGATLPLSDGDWGVKNSTEHGVSARFGSRHCALGKHFKAIFILGPSNLPVLVAQYDTSFKSARRIALSLGWQAKYR